MRKVISIGLVILVIVGYFIYKQIPPPPQPPTQFTTSSVSYDMKDEPASTVNAYIDASGSMKGYFSLQSDGRFITALSNVNPNKTVWMDASRTELTGVPTNQLLTNRFSGGDSRFDKMLSSIIIKDSLDKSGILSLLFTDGIISASVRETVKNPLYMIQSFGVFKNYITNELKKCPGVAVAIFKLDSKYNGTYWNYENKPVNNVNIDDRPFYVIAMAKPSVIRSFVSSNKLSAQLTAQFGVYDKNEINVNGTTFVPTIQKDWNNSQLKGNTIGFCLSLPEYIAKLGDEYNKANLIIEFDGEDKTAELASCVSIMGQNLRLENWQTSDVSKPIITPGNHSLEIKIKKTLQNSWANLFSENDKNIKSVIAEQKKTFALEYLLKGIQEGVEENDMIIFSSRIEFSK